MIALSFPLTTFEVTHKPSTPPSRKNRGFLLLSGLVLKVRAHPVAKGWSPLGSFRHSDRCQLRPESSQTLPFQPEVHGTITSDPLPCEED